MAVHSHGSEAYDLSLFEPKKAKIVSLPENKKVQKGAGPQGPAPFSAYGIENGRGQGCMLVRRA